MTNIHPTAIVDPSAELADGVQVGPYAILEKDVYIGEGTTIGPWALIAAGTEVGRHCQIHAGAVVGHEAQHLDGGPEHARCIIGDHNVIREYATIHRGARGEAVTRIGDHNLFMGHSHVAHDCVVGSHIVLCNNSLLAGHVVVEDRAFISGNVCIHQFCRIGTLVMIGGGSRISCDVPPYTMVVGDSMIRGFNTIGMRRAGLSSEARQSIRRAYARLFKTGFLDRQMVDELNGPGSLDELKNIRAFLEKSQRQVCHWRRPREVRGFQGRALP